MTEVLLPLARHVDGIAAAADRLVTWADDAGFDASVPTCPGWTVGDLVAHQGMVHRWATAMLEGADHRTVGIDSYAGEAATVVWTPDAGAWLLDGVENLLTTLSAVLDEERVFTFLREAPSPRLFWARRQHHETAMHALDALAARDARPVTPGDVWFGPDVSLDAVDELLVGFWPRRTKGPRADGPYVAVVETGGRRWRLDIGPEAPVTTRLGADDTVPADAHVLSGPPCDIHLALWNRGGAPEDPTGLLPRWAAAGVV